MKLELNNLTTGYGTKTITPQINAQLISGELVALLGCNGTGKSTLLRTLGGFQPSLCGEMLLDGKPLADYSAKERARLISVVLTDRIETEHMTARELVLTGRMPYTGFWGANTQADYDIADEAMQQTGTTSLAARLVSSLSDGERQKVIIAKALAQQTPVILLDEPSAFLDYPSKVDLMQLLNRLASEQHKIILISTHDVEIACRTAHRAWLLDRSHALQQLSCREALQHFIKEQ